MTIQGIDKETAEGLVKGGFHSLEGLLAADLNDLTDIFRVREGSGVHNKPPMRSRNGVKPPRPASGRVNRKHNEYSLYMSWQSGGGLSEQGHDRKAAHNELSGEEPLQYRRQDHGRVD